MDIKRCGSQPSSKGLAEYFTGAVRIDPLFQAIAPARALGANVTFEPGARTAWHTHPLGQTLIVMAGCGLAQRWGGPVEQIRPGDVVWFPPGEKHWHGATAMTHIAIQEQLDGKVVDWREQVSDEQYRARHRAGANGHCPWCLGLSLVVEVKLLTATRRRNKCRSANSARATWKLRPSVWAVWA
jgi:quercetin dioxygenase-like cupin family protein